MRLGLASLPLLLMVAAPTSPARASQFPTRQGEAGLLDVPSAEVIDRSTAMLGFEVGWDHAPGTADRFGPLPLSLGVGLGRLELGVSARESGFPGDSRPAPMLFGAALKAGLIPAIGQRPAVAVDVYLDRFNLRGAGGGRLILSTRPVGQIELTGFAGYEKQAAGSAGWTAGLAGLVRTKGGLETVVEAIRNPRGNLFGAALRWDVSSRFGLAVGASYLPDERGIRISLGFGFHGVPLRQAQVATARPITPAVPPVSEPEPEPTLAMGERPSFKLKIRPTDPGRLGEPRHTQYAPYTAPALAGGRPAAPPRAAAPSTADVLAARLRDQELQAEARAKQLGAADDVLAADEDNLEADARRLEERERVLAAREAQLDSRETRAPGGAALTEPQRQLQAREAQLATTERQLAAQERGLAPTVEAALGTERHAQAREQAERAEADRLMAQAGAEKSGARQGELIARALAARERMLAAMDGRVTARGARLDAVGRQLHGRGERATTWQRRLDVRAERLDLSDQLLRGAAGAPTAGLPMIPSPFAVVVKVPTFTMKPGSGGNGELAAAREVPAGIAADKAVVAATVVSLASPGAELSELDRETVAGVARLAARENHQVLIWARAKNPGLVGEASRRAEELKALVIGIGGLPPNHVVTRITTRASAQGVDVVISALREGGKARAEATRGLNGSNGGAGPARLAGGETARRQLRDAVVAVQPVIERCISDQLLRRGVSGAEGSLELDVTSAGLVTGVRASAGDLGNGDLGQCLRASATSWRFPTAGGDYVVDVPITVVGAGETP